MKPKNQLILLASVVVASAALPTVGASEGAPEVTLEDPVDVLCRVDEGSLDAWADLACFNVDTAERLLVGAAVNGRSLSCAALAVAVAPAGIRVVCG